MKIRKNMVVCLVCFIWAASALTLVVCPPARAQGAPPKFKVRADLAPAYRMFIPGHTRLEDLGEFTEPFDIPENNNGAANGQKSRVSVSVSRMASGGLRLSPSENDRFNKWNMLKSLPGDFSNAPTYQEKLELIGKIFEPKVTLDIEF
jgi:hypothetical protein